MATVWKPYKPSSCKWMLADGTLIDPPAIEISSGGRRVRPAGGGQSRPYYEYTRVIRDALKAMGHGSAIPVFGTDEERFRAAISHTIGGDVGDKALLPAALEDGRVIQAMRFEDPTCPHLDAWMVNILQTVGVNTYHQTYMCYRDTMSNQGSPGYIALLSDDGWARPYNMSFEQAVAWDKVFAAGPPEKNVSLGSGNGHTRKMIKAFVERARELDATDYVYMPDLRDTDNPKWVKLERVYSNWTSEADSDLAAVSNAAPVVEQLINCTAQMRKLLASLGVSVQAVPKESDWFQAAAGDIAAINVTVRSEVGVDETDHQHVVYLHLLSGAVHVACSNYPITKNEAGEAWEVAQFKAELTGQADELLVFAQEYVRRNGVEKAKAIRDARLDVSDS